MIQANELTALLLTAEQAAVAAGTSLPTIWRAVRAGKLASYRRGAGRRGTRFLPADVGAFKRNRSRAA